MPLAAFAAEVKKPNILWLVAENIGPDLGCYGYPVVKTPNLDRFAQEGMRYRLAFSTSPFCSPSRSAILTGMYQTSIGAHHHRSHFIEGLDADFTLPAGVRPFTELLREAGYYCANIKTIAGRAVGTGKTDFNFKLTGDPMMTESVGKGRSAEKNKRNNGNFARAFAGDEWLNLPKDRPF